jgi:tetratricopeptide (TPR) repeat protein
MLPRHTIRRLFSGHTHGAFALAAWVAFGASVQDPIRSLRMLVVSSEPEAVRLRNQLQTGASFQALAREFSIDASAGQGGYLRVDPRNLRTEFQTALQGLEPGQVSAVTRVADQFVLLKWLTPEEELWSTSQDAGQAAIRDRAWAEAVEAFTVAVQTADTSGLPARDLSESLRGLAEAYRAREDYPEAESAYERMLSVRWGGSTETNRNFIQSLDRFAEVLWLADFRGMDFDTALDAFLERMKSVDPPPQLFLAMAGELTEALLPDVAETVMLEAVERSPDSRELRYELAEMYAKSMEYEKALEAFERAGQMPDPGLDPATDRIQRAVIHERTGQIYTGLNRFDEAAAAFQAALEIDPGRLDSRLGLAKLDADAGRLEKAVSEYEAIVRDNPRSVRAYHALARTNLQLDRLPEAIAAANRALAIDGSYETSRYVLGRALTRSGRTEEGRRALEQYRQALAGERAGEDENRVIGLLYREGMSLLLEGHVDEAVAMLRTGVTAHPTAGVILRQALGTALRRSGQYDAAIRVFEDMVGLGAGDLLLAYQSLAASYEAIGDTGASLRSRVSYLAEYDASLTRALN